MKLSKKIIWIGLVVIVLIAAGGYAYYQFIYLPKQTTSSQPTLQTATVRQGDLILYASGTGTLTAANTVNLAFTTSGEIQTLNVKVGDQVKQGDLLAAVDTTSAEIALTQAKRNLLDLTSPSAVASAQETIATAQNSLQSARNHLAYVISPAVMHWEEEVTKAEAAVQAAQSAVAANSTDAAAQQALKDAQASLAHARSSLASAQAAYETDYLPANFTVSKVDPKTHKLIKYIAAPTDADILSARAGVVAAQASLDEANNLYNALTGGEVPDNATGSGLTALEQAQLDVQSAQHALEGTRLVAPFAGTIMAVNNQVGDTVSSSTTVITLSDLSQPSLQIFLDASDWNNVKVGYPVNITFDLLPDTTYKGTVTGIDPGLYSENNSSVVRAYVKLDSVPSDFNIPLGANASVDVIAGQATNAILVPIEALHQAGDQYTVFVQQNGKLILRVVQIGIQDDSFAEVKSGLNVGDVVSTGITQTSSNTSSTSTP